MQENSDKKITLQIHPRNFELSYNRFRAYNRDKLQTSSIPIPDPNLHTLWPSKCDPENDSN